MAQRSLSCLAILLAMAMAGAVATADAERSPAVDLEAAKELYREGHFGAAIVKLQALLDELPLVRDLALRRLALADAYLHLALSHVALDERDAAREALRGMRRADPTRTLSPEVYAPKVRALYDEVLAQPEEEATAAALLPAVSARKRRLRTPLILGAGAAVAGGTVALASRGGAGGPPSHEFPDSTMGSGSARIEWLGATPAPGSTVPLLLAPCPRGLTAACTRSVNMVFSVTSDVDRADVFLKVQLLNGSIPCLEGFSFDTGFSAQRLAAGVPAQMVVNPLNASLSCASPFTTTSVGAILYARPSAQQLATRSFGGGYRFTP